MNDPNIWTVQGCQSGPTVAIFGGVHGDERAGVEIIRQLRQTLHVDRGTVYLVLANPPAVARGKRMVGKNLNRRLLPGNDGQAPEDIRARELMALLDRCDALLDLHEHKDDAIGDFIACDPPSFDVAKAINAPMITYNWDDAEPGATDGYMFGLGKIGICYEAGNHVNPEENVKRQMLAVARFLNAMGMTEADVGGPSTGKSAPTRPRFVKILRAIHKRTESFRLVGSFHTFDPLPRGVFAVDEGVEYIAGAGEVIIFPRSQNPVGTEAAIIGRFTQEPLPGRYTKKLYTT